MRTKKRTSATSRFTRGQKVVAKKTRRHGRPRADAKRAEEGFGRTLDRLTPL